MTKALSILGTGNMAAGLAKLFSDKGISVVLGSRNPSEATAKASSMGSNAKAASLEEAVRAAQVIILAVPYSSVKEVLDRCGSLAGKILIDITNPLSPDYKELTIGFSTSAAEEIQKQAAGARVVKAFNTIFAQMLPASTRAGKSPVQVFVAGDDVEAKMVVSGLVELTGFKAVDAGALTNARYLEPVAEMTIHFGFMLGWGTGIAPAWQVFS